jgi:hypothetical protein
MEPIHSKKYKAKVKSTRTHVTKEHNNQDILDTTNYIIFKNVENLPQKWLKHPIILKNSSISFKMWQLWLKIFEYICRHDDYFILFFGFQILHKCEK